MPPRPTLERLSWIAGIISAILAAIALIYSFWPGSSADNASPSTIQVSQAASSVGNQIGAIHGDVTIVGSVAGTLKDEQKIPLLFKFGIIGNDVNWFEKISGPPTRKSENGKIREYKIDDCDVELDIRPDGTIEIATIYVSPACTFNWRAMDPNHANLPPPNQMKFEAAMRQYDYDTTFTISCLRNCGNSVAPRAELMFGGSHANNWIATTVGAIIDGDNNIKVANEIVARIIKDKGEDFVVDLKYSCDYDLNEIAKGVAERFKVDYVSFQGPVIARTPFVGENQKCK